MPDPEQPPTTPTPDPEGQTGRDRLVAALRSPSRGQAVVGVLLMVLGVAAVVQVRANDRNDNFVGARQSDLIALINTLNLATDRAESEIVELEHTRDSLRDDAESSQTALSVARQRADTLGILAGTLPAVGSGVRITVDSKSGTIGTDQLLNGLEELRNAGAEAIEINDSVRVVAQTGLVDSPTQGLVVGGQPVQAPYVVDVIGDPHTLATALDFDGGFIEEVESVGGSVDVKELDDVEIASVVKPADPIFAKPVDQQ
jgi:uncharacterized protein YlxW (UPF0749 family)